MQSLPHPHRRSFAILQAALAVLLLAANLAPLAQLWIPIYYLVVDTRDVKLCVGETEIVNVFVFLEVSAADHYYYYGETIGTAVSDRQVASISPELAITTPGGYGGRTSRLLRLPKFRGAFINQPIDEYFSITGEKAGTATITFTHTQARRRGFARAAAVSVQVEVIDCYEAFAWGHGATFPRKDICGFDRPFKLKAKTPGVAGITESSVAMNFHPLPPNGGTLNGNYNYTTKITITAGGITQSGTTEGKGTYTVIFYGQGLIREGDIILTGTYTEYWDNGFVFSSAEDTRIAFRPLPAGRICTEWLP